MKVITEERLREILKSYSDSSAAAMHIELLLRNECQDLDTLTVTRLRPMSDAPELCNFMVKMKDREELTEACFSIPGHLWVRSANYPMDCFEGWIPMPRYEPEKA